MSLTPYRRVLSRPGDGGSMRVEGYAMTGGESGEHPLGSASQGSEIGAELYLSLNTVKSHTRSIFRKLGVSGREQAVAHARELELI